MRVLIKYFDGAGEEISNYQSLKILGEWDYQITLTNGDVVVVPKNDVRFLVVKNDEEAVVEPDNQEGE